MKLPKKIKIGDFSYTIKKHSKPFKSRVKKDSESIGEIDYAHKILELVVGDRRMKSILFHELFHGILYFLGYDKEVKENVIDGLVAGLRMVMIDNPALIELLKK